MNYNENRPYENVESVLSQIKKALHTCPEMPEKEELQQLLSYRTLDYHRLQAIVCCVSANKDFLYRYTDIDLGLFF
jgi:vacuolar-type H+-ATPase subunit E/Vma4